MEVMKIMVTSFKGPMHTLPHPVPPTLQQATTDPHLRWRLLDTHRKVWVSLWGHCSFLLGPGAQGSVCALQESPFPVLCEFWQLYSGVNGDLLQEGLCHTQVCHTLTLWQATADLFLHRRHSNTVLSRSLWGLWVLVCTRYV